MEGKRIKFNPYDLSTIGGVNVCGKCGLRKRPKKFNPYDASQGGLINYCKC
jgi:hypothetical protein